MHRATRRAIAASAVVVTANAASAQCDFTVVEPDDWSPCRYEQGRMPRLETSGNWAAINSWSNYLGIELDAELGRILIFRNDNGAWLHDHTIVDPLAWSHSSLETQFAATLAIRGDRIFATDPRHQLLYIFEHDGNSWNQVAALDTPFDPELPNADHRATGIAAHEHGVVVSGRDSEGDGMVAWFEEDPPGQWTLAQTFQHPDGTSVPTHFAEGLALSGDELAVTADGGSDSFDDIFIYTYAKGSWSLDSRLSDSTGPLQRLSPTIEFNDDVIVVAGPWTFTTLEISLNVFERIEGNWSRQELDVPTTIVDGVNCFGYVRNGIDITDDRILVTRSSFDSIDGDEYALYLYERNADWELSAVVSPSNIRRTTQLGYASMSSFGADAAFSDQDELLVHGLTGPAHADFYASQPAMLVYPLDDPLGEDFDGNGICDHLDILAGAPDLDANLRHDDLEITLGLRDDCDANGIPDDLDHDLDGNGVPIGCEDDCNGNDIPDSRESDYGFDAYQRPFMLYTLTGDFQDQLWMRPIEVEAGRETIDEITIHRGGYRGQPNVEIIILRDPDNNDDLTQAELLLQYPINLNDGVLGNALRVEIPETTLGVEGDQVYLGLRIIDGLFRNAYLMFRDAEPVSFTINDLVIFGKVDGQLDLANLVQSDIVYTGGGACIAIEANRGPRAICCADTDLTGDDITDVRDLLAVLAAWGPCDDCPEDIDEDGQVNVNDLLHVLAQWGDCSG